MKVKSLCAAAAAALSLTAVATASASSIVYDKGGNLFLSTPDGTSGYQVTFDGGWSSPSQSDDGTIMALKAHRMYRISPSGTVLSGSDGLYTPDSPYSQFHGPFGPQISPDGAKVAYWGGYDETASWDGYNWWQLDVSTVWGPADHFAMPGQTLGQQDYSEPSWIGNGRLLLTNSISSWIKQVAVYAVGGADNTEVQWFSDPSAPSLEQGVASRDETKLAFSAGDSASVGTNEIRLYTTQGLPSGNASDPLPPDPVERCTINAPGAGDPSLSPDGSSLVWDEPDGLHVASVTNLSDCSTLQDHLLIAGGTQPFWGPADMNMANKPGSGSTPGSTGGTPGTSGGGTHGTGGGTPGTSGGTGHPTTKPPIHHRPRHKKRRRPHRRHAAHRSQHSHH